MEVSNSPSAVGARGQALARTGTDAGIRESRFRIVGGVAIGLMLTQAAFGLAWDIRWHALVGRDTFFTPPHLLLYTGVAMAGFIALGVVLAETARYYRGSPAVNDNTTTRVMWYFHAPLGFIVSGFGLLTMLVAAPLDNYWHELYGIDVALWAPFHVMGIIGGFISGLGVIYLFASEAAISRERGGRGFRLMGFTGTELGVLFTMSMVLALLITAAQPATNQFITTWVGPVEFLTYPALLALFLPATGMAAVVATRRPGAAGLVALLYALRQVVFNTLVPWCIWWTLDDASQLRVSGWRPGVSWNELLIPFVFVVPMLAIDLMFAARQRSISNSRAPVLTPAWAALTGLVAALPVLVIAPLLVRTLLSAIHQLNLPPSIVVGSLPSPQALALGVPVALVCGALAAAVGLGWGRFLRVYRG